MQPEPARNSAGWYPKRFRDSPSLSDFVGQETTLTPKLRAMAPECYDTLKSHSSWSALLFQFIFDKRYSLSRRVERMKGTSEALASSAAKVDSARGVALGATGSSL